MTDFLVGFMCGLLVSAGALGLAAAVLWAVWRMAAGTALWR